MSKGYSVQTRIESMPLLKLEVPNPSIVCYDFANQTIGMEFSLTTLVTPEHAYLIS